jgi:hypothetical protein
VSVSFVRFTNFWGKCKGNHCEGSFHCFKLFPHRVASYWKQMCTVGGTSIDYRCGDDEGKKNSWVGATSWYHCAADDSRIPKMPVISPLQALVHPQTQKKLSWMDCQSPTPTSQNSPFFFGK